MNTVGSFECDCLAGYIKNEESLLCESKLVFACCFYVISEEKNPNNLNSTVLDLRQN